MMIISRKIHEIVPGMEILEAWKGWSYETGNKRRA